MSRDEQFQGSKRAAAFGPSLGSPLSSRFHGGGGVSQRQQLHRSTTSAKKPPEPLRRAVADCLSSSAPHLHGNHSALSSEAARTLQYYIASPATTDLAYSVLLEHALAERDRSPAVVARCVALLKRYLLRYIPKVQTLRQIDVFCVNSIAECDTAADRRVSLWSKLLSQHSGGSTSGNAFPPSLATRNFASVSLVKSLNYVRSLVARHIPKLSFQPVSFTGASNTVKQPLPTLSSLLSRSFNSQLIPEAGNSHESPERKEILSPSALNPSSLEKVDGAENNKYFFIDLLKWRWPRDREQQSSAVMTESDGVVRTQDVRTHGFLEVGAAALLVVDVESKMKGRPWKYSDTKDFPDIDPMLQPSTVTTARIHIKAITASKRMKPDLDQVWVNVPASTFRPRARPLFHYRHYSEQQPLRFNPAEVSDVLAAVCSESSSQNMNLMATSLRLSNRGGTPSTDVAVSVLIKLVIDTYMMDSGTAAPLILSMLEDILNSPRVASRVRAFDIILNLGVHAHLLEPMLPEDLPTIGEDESSEESYFNNDGQLVTLGRRNTVSNMQHRIPSAAENFESWLLVILFKTLLLLVQKEEREEIIWASALSCLFYFVCDRGQIWRKRLAGLDIRVIKALLEISREHSWAEVVHCKLICMLANMFYQVSDELTNPISDSPVFLVDQVDLLGGIEFICLEYSRANSREEKRNLFLVLFDYVLHQINESCLSNGGSAYTSDEVQPLATMLTLADAPEAFYIAVKHGVEGIGEILRRSISTALSITSNYERLNLLLDKITRKLDGTISSFTDIDKEFSYMIRITKSYKTLKSIEDGLVESDIGMKAKLSWTTLHSLLHSERAAYRHNGYIWLVELLLSEISEEGDMSIWFNIKKLQQQIGIAGSQDSTTSSVPLPISIMCSLLRSKHNNIRWGFLFVLEKLLMRCKLLLDENELQHLSNGEVVSYGHSDSRLEKANAVIDIMSCALTLVVQVNETDRINILKMCDMLFSQLCLRFLPAKGIPLGELRGLGNLFCCTNESSLGDGHFYVPQYDKNGCRDEFLGDSGVRTHSNEPPLNFETASMAALLLRGYAVVPMQLVARVPTSLFYWPLIQLAGAATDDIALGVAVGSKGRGNLPGATSDIRAGLLLFLISKCTADPAAFVEVGEEDFFRELLDDTDSRVAYYSSAFLLKRMMTEQPENYQRMLQSLIFKAQQSNNEKLLENPYLQMRGILQLSSDLGTQL